MVDTVDKSQQKQAKDLAALFEGDYSQRFFMDNEDDNKARVITGEVKIADLIKIVPQLTERLQNPFHRNYDTILLLRDSHFRENGLIYENQQIPTVWRIINEEEYRPRPNEGNVLDPGSVQKLEAIAGEYEPKVVNMRTSLLEYNLPKADIKPWRTYKLESYTRNDGVAPILMNNNISLYSNQAFETTDKKYKKQYLTKKINKKNVEFELQWEDVVPDRLVFDLVKNRVFVTNHYNLWAIVTEAGGQPYSVPDPIDLSK